MPVILYILLQSIRLLSDAAASFTEHRIVGIEANEAPIAEHVAQSLMLVTALHPHIGYDKAAEIAHAALANHTTLREAAVTGSYVSAEEFDRLMNPDRMLGPDVTSNPSN